MSKQHHLILLAVICVSWLVNAQVSVPGRYRPSTAFLKSTKTLLQHPHFILPELNETNHQVLLAQRQSEGEKDVPFKFGNSVAVDIDMDKHGNWSVDETKGTISWNCVVQAPGSQSVSVSFSKFILPDEAEFYVLGRDTNKDIRGAFTRAKNVKEDGQFLVAPVIGDLLIMHYVEPLISRKSLKNRPKITVEKIIRGAKASPFGYGQAGNCHIDIACPEGKSWKDQSNSVVVIIKSDGDRSCSGAMINNGGKEGRQLLLTAYHCISGDYKNTLVGFGYEHSSCGNRDRQTGRDVDPKTAHGLKLIAKFEPSDFALFEVIERIPDNWNVFMAGWDSRKIQPTGLVGIHHPEGDAKKISTYDGQATWAKFGSTDQFGYHLKINGWTKGATEQGSSGSPLFNKRKLIVGHLHGGFSDCDNNKRPDFYGAVHYDWTKGKSRQSRLKDHLDPENKGLRMLEGAYLKDLRKKVRNSGDRFDSDEDLKENDCNDEYDYSLESISFESF